MSSRSTDLTSVPENVDALIDMSSESASEIETQVDDMVRMIEEAVIDTVERDAAEADAGPDTQRAVRFAPDVATPVARSSQYRVRQNTPTAAYRGPPYEDYVPRQTRAMDAASRRSPQASTSSERMPNAPLRNARTLSRVDQFIEEQKRLKAERLKAARARAPGP